MNKNENTDEKKIYTRIQFISKYFWNSLSIQSIDKFKSNFTKDDKIAPLSLIDMLIYYSNDNIRQISCRLIDMLKRDMWINNQSLSQSSSQEIHDYCKSILKETYIVPIGDPSKSSWAMPTIFKRAALSENEMNVIKIEDMPLAISKRCKMILFLDDVIGTGTQFDRFLNSREYFDKKTTIADLARLNPEIKFYYLAFLASNQGIIKITAKHPFVKILACEILDESFAVDSKNNEYWEINPYYDQVMNILAETNKKYPLDDKFSLKFPVLFETARANNTSYQLYWDNYNNAWKPLVRR